MFKAKFHCERGHEQTITYDRTFTREMAEDHCALMFGGVLHSIKKEMPPVGDCAWQENDGPRCGAKVSYEVEEVEQ